MNKRRTKQLDAVSFWPGYVDALVNVVLNILFLVGLLAVGLMTTNVDAIGKNKDLRVAQALERIRAETLLLAALGTVESSIRAMLPEARNREAQNEQMKTPIRPSPPVLPVSPPRVDHQKVIQIGRVASTQSRTREAEWLQSAGLLPGRHWQMHQEKRMLDKNELSEVRALVSGAKRLVLFATYPQDRPEYKEPIYLLLQKTQLGLMREGYAAGNVRLLMRAVANEQHIPGDMVYLWIDNAEMP